MPRTKAMNHVHKYYRLDSTGLWHCSLCTHYMPANMPIPVWKRSRCWKCDKYFELNPDNMRMDYPICQDCKADAPSVADEDEKLEKYLYELRMKKLAALAPPKDEIEITHAADCDTYIGGDCTCR